MTSGPLRGLVEVLIEDQREFRREIRSDFRELRAEIESLKTDRAKGKGWIAGALAVVSLIVSAVAALSGCATVPAPETSLPTAQWVVRPVRVVLDSSMSSRCLSSAQQALTYWQAQGVNYLTIEYAAHDWIGFDGLPPAGTISITSDDLVGAVAGETLTSRYSGCLECIRTAEIWLDRCTVEVVAHELGHALGLHHDYTTGNLMFPVSFRGAFDLTSEQRTWVE